MASNEVHCPSCDRSVVGQIRGSCSLEAEVADEGMYEHGVCTLYKCSECGEPIVEVLTEMVNNEWGEPEPFVVYPLPPISPLVNEFELIPKIVRVPLCEAERCFQNNLNFAFCAMVSKLVNSLCKDRELMIDGVGGVNENRRIDEDVAEGLQWLHQLGIKAINADADEPSSETVAKAREIALWVVRRLYRIDVPSIPAEKDATRYRSQRVRSSVLADRAVVYCKDGPLQNLSIVKEVLEKLHFPDSYQYSFDEAIGKPGNWQPLFVWVPSTEIDRSLLPRLVEVADIAYKKLIESQPPTQCAKLVKTYQIQRKLLLNRLTDLISGS